jgi:predicted neuraminidase
MKQLFETYISSFRRRPESSAFNQLDTGFRRCDEVFKIFLCLFGLIALAFSAAFYKVAHLPVASVFQTPAPALSPVAAPRLESHFASQKLFTQVHAASAIALKNGQIRAFWFSGSREGAKDVAIHSAVFDPVTSRWADETVTVTREQTQSVLHRYVSKIGNPVVTRAEDGSLRLFYVSVSLGGWAGSSINTMISLDEGESWSAPRRLITSPFINISTLVKGAPFLYQDGTLGVPVYHEFISKFAELLRVDQNGVVLDKQRLVRGGEGSLQPVVFIQNSQQATILMRDGGASNRHRVLAVSSQDAAQHWSPVLGSELANPDAALTGVTLANGQLLAVLNNQTQGRDTLSLMLSADNGQHWKSLKLLENQQDAATDFSGYALETAKLIQQTQALSASAEQVESTRRTTCGADRCRYEFSYPYLIQTTGGDFHLFYTWNRTFIKHLWFNQSWLNQRLAESENHATH